MNCLVALFRIGCFSVQLLWLIRKFFRSSLQSFHRLEGTAYDNSHIPIKLTDTNPPFFKRRAVDFFLCFFLCHRLGVLHLEQGSHILQGNDIQTVLFKERGGCGFRSSPQSFHRLEGVAYDNSHIPIKLTDYQAYNHLEFSIIKEAIDWWLSQWAPYQYLSRC